MTEYYLWLLQLMGAASPRSVQLIRRFGNAEKVYEAYQTGALSFIKPNASASLEESLRIMKICEQHDYRIITLGDADYPVALKNIYNPPLVLFVLGELPREELAVAVIGTRNASEYSVNITRRLSESLARCGVTIVSGMAVGVDKTAHTAAVGAGGRTIGVLACGFLVDYPKNSTPFRKEIAEKGGAVISELPPESRGDKGYFNRRNRIISGLSRGVLITEAGEKSGCHITAAHAISQNRDLFCVPPADIFSQAYRGVIGYIRDGATPVFDHSDILNEYLIKPLILDEQEIKPETIITNTKPVQLEPEKPPIPDMSVLSEDAQAIAELLRDGAQTVDYLTRQCGFPPDILSDLLIELEIDGVVRGIAGSRYELL